MRSLVDFFFFKVNYSMSEIQLIYTERSSEGVSSWILRKHVRICGEELWYYMRKPGVGEKNVKVVLDMYEDSDSWELCSRTDRSVLSRGGFTSGSHPLLVCMMTDDVRREYLWTMMLADDIV